MERTKEELLEELEMYKKAILILKNKLSISSYESRYLDGTLNTFYLVIDHYGEEPEFDEYGETTPNEEIQVPISKETAELFMKVRLTL